MLTTRQKVAIARLCAASLVFSRRLVGQPPEVEVMRDGIRWRLDLREGIDLAVYLRVYEPDTLNLCKRLTSPGSIAIDIGANMGAYTLHLAMWVSPNGRVFAFEPTEYAFRKQQTNIALNPQLSPVITSEQIMLAADDSGSIQPQIYSSWPLDDTSETHETHCGRLMATSGARVSTLDTYVRDAGIDRVDLIKLDVDGNELEVLRGSQETLSRFKPRIVMELSPHQQAEHGHSIGDLVALLVPLGYRFHDEATGAVLPTDGQRLEDLIRPGASINVFLAQTV